MWECGRHSLSSVETNAFRNLKQYWWQCHSGWILFNTTCLLCKDLKSQCENSTNTVDFRYLALVGSQNSRARVKWFSRYLALSREGADSRIQDHRPTLPGVYNSCDNPTRNHDLNKLIRMGNRLPGWIIIYSTNSQDIMAIGKRLSLEISDGCVGNSLCEIGSSYSYQVAEQYDIFRLEMILKCE